MRDDGLHYPTETIVSKRIRKHYKIPVQSHHWQLRSLIGAEKKNIVYFPGGPGCNHVLRLDTTTREYETIRLLTFPPRCLVAGAGWLCCGSEHGEFVAIRPDEEPYRPHLNYPSLDLDPQVQSPNDNTGEDTIFHLLARARRASKSLVAPAVKLANDRVNCITLWAPSRRVPLCDYAYTFPVAVLANNDQTVKLVNLEAAGNDEKVEAIDTLTYPDYVNRAAISPDGRLLVAILDDPYLYVHERVPGYPTSGQTRLRTDAEGGWELKQRILLKSQRKDDQSDNRGSFAACFSSSGAYLAVGTQHGTISIFDTSLLTDSDADPVITTFTSSRPRSGPGAIRDMAFCPGPFDILAWTEDRGHIGVADVRSNFVVRQILDISIEADYEHINILDRNTVDPRLLDRRNERESSSSQPSNATRGAPDGVLGLNSLNQPLSRNEMMVLEALQNDRRRRERASQRHNWTSDAMGSAAYPGTAQAETTPTSTQEHATNATQAINNLIGNYRDQRAHERARIARAQAARDTADRAQTSRRSEGRWLERLSENVAALRDHRERQDSSYLSVLEILQARERGTDGDQDDSALLVPLVNQVMSRWEESAIRGTLVADSGFFDVPPSPDNTAGLSWSDDGRILFIGAQNGIYEFHINIDGRKLAPSIRPR